MKKFKYKIYISMAVVWMIIIFINSSLEGDTSSGLSASIISFMVRVLQILGDSSSINNTISIVESDGFHLFLRKTAHLVEFAILGILFTASLGYFNKIRNLYMKRFSIAIGLAIIYAATDEVHQLFVAGRAGTVVDVLIDALGAILGASCLVGIIHLKRNKMKKDKTDDNVNRLPNLICPGAQKAGTTTLFNLLKQHPDITGAEYKEIQFFDKYYHKGINWYMKMCRDTSEHRYIMDFTPGYMTEEIYIKRMKEVLEDDVKFIIILRNPADRMYSNYLMNLRVGLEYETDAIKAFNRDYKSYLDGDKTAKYFRHSMYAEQVSQLKKMFSDKNLKIVLFEDMISDTERVIMEILEYLELGIPETMDFSVWNNKADNTQAHWLIRFIRRVFRRKTNILTSLLPYKLNKYLKKIFIVRGQKPAVTEEVKKDPEVCGILTDRCLDDIKKLEEILGRKLDIWIDKYRRNSLK